MHAGADHIDAVEIDPHLLELGRGHPLAPYDDPRVDAHVTDGRAFLEASDDRWDTILLALPDSLTLLQGQSSVRLESYLFTEEAVEAYRDHLADGGVFAMYNYYREPWLVDRYAATLERVFGEPPCVTTLPGDTSAVIVVSEDPGPARLPGRVDVRRAWPPHRTRPPTTTRSRTCARPSIPSFYLVALGFMLALSLIGVRLAGGPFRQMVPFADLFFMGVAFLLLETKNVVQFALLFGTTWFVNAFVFGGVLVSVLLAVAHQQARRDPQHRAPLRACSSRASRSTGSCPPTRCWSSRWCPASSRPSRLAFFPIFVANLVFASRFRDTERSTAAFGANLLGAMVGGLLEYVSLLTGYRSLLVLVAGALRPGVPAAARIAVAPARLSATALVRRRGAPAGAAGSARSRRRAAGRGPASRGGRRSAGAS